MPPHKLKGTDANMRNKGPHVSGRASLSGADTCDMLSLKIKLRNKGPHVSGSASLSGADASDMLSLKTIWKSQRAVRTASASAQCPLACSAPTPPSTHNTQQWETLKRPTRQLSPVDEPRFSVGNRRAELRQRQRKAQAAFRSVADALAHWRAIYF